MTNIKEGDRFWYYRLGFYRSGRSWAATRPTEIIVSKITVEKRSEWDEKGMVRKPYNRIEFKKASGKIFFDDWEENLCIVSEQNIDDEPGYWWGRLYTTKELALCSWNKKVKNEIDKARFEFEERIKRLNKKLIDEGRG